MKNTHKIGFWTTWLHGRHQVNGSGSLVSLTQCNTNSWTANVQSQSSLSELPSFKSHFASLELLLPNHTEFLILSTWWKAVPSADQHEPPSLGLLYFANVFFHEMWNVDLTYMMAEENPKNENVKSSCRTLMIPEQAPAFELPVSQQMENIWQPPHNNPAGLGSHVLDQIPWSSQLEQNHKEYCYVHQCLEMSLLQQFSRQYVMFKSSSICFTSLSTKPLDLDCYDILS